MSIQILNIVNWIYLYEIIFVNIKSTNWHIAIQKINVVVSIFEI